MIRVLLVEDDLRLATALTDVLTSQGFDVAHASTGAQALQARAVDIVLLDLGLPDMDGLSVLTHLRARFDMAQAGIIVLTARGQLKDRISGLRTGADDYLTKPVSVAELTARIEAVARRTSPDEQHLVEVGALCVDLASRRVTLAGTAVALTGKEFDLLSVLAHEPGAAVTRQHLMMRVWGTSWPSTQRSLEVHVSALRSKLGPALIETVRGVGYRLAAS